MAQVDIVPVNYPHTKRINRIYLNDLHLWGLKDPSWRGQKPEPYITYTCSECGDIKASDSYGGNELRNRLRSEQICFGCDFWRQRYVEYQKNWDNPKSRMTIIDGHWYSPGDGSPGQQGLGMAGRKFNIEYIDGPHKGKRITTHDLWAGGMFPAKYLDLIKDNARFIQASKAQVGDTTCWNHTMDSPWNVPYMPPRMLFGR